MVNNRGSHKTSGNAFHSSLFQVMVMGCIFMMWNIIKLLTNTKLIFHQYYSSYINFACKTPCTRISTGICTHSWSHDHKACLHTWQIKHQFLLTNVLLLQHNSFFFWIKRQTKSHTLKTSLMLPYISFLWLTEDVASFNEEYIPSSSWHQPHNILELEDSSSHTPARMHLYNIAQEPK